MEIYIIIGVIVVQVWVFIKALGRISSYEESIPSKNQYDLHSNFTKLDVDDEDSPRIKMYEIQTSLSYGIFPNIVSAINKYLQNNKGATADMSLLTNIVKRNINRQENEISILIPIPLYLGLVGTMAGIIFGLFNIPSVGDSGFAEGLGIDILIGGVKYAMIASVAGIIFTTLLSGWFFRKAKYQVESSENEFLTFLETRLLPVLKADVSANLHNLYQNLASFNHRFEKGVDKLSGIMTQTHEAVVSQLELIDELQRIDLTRIAGANVEVFKEMRELMPQFNLLNGYISGLNESFEKSKALTSSISGVLQRTNDVGDIASYLQESTNNSIKLNEIVETHYKELQDRNQEFVLATNNMEDKAKLAIDHFRVFIEEQISALKEVTRREEDLMIKAFEENRNVLGKLNELSEIKEELKKLSEKPDPQMDLSDEFDRLIEALSNIKIGRINKQRGTRSLSPKNILNGLKSWLKKLRE